MHIQYTDLPELRSLPEGTTLEYATQDQDCRSLERFAIRTLNAGMRTPEIIDETRESFWIIISGEGTMTRGDETTQIRPRDLIITPPGVPHSLAAGDTPVKWFDVAFHSSTWGIAAEALEGGIGDPHARPYSRKAITGTGRRAAAAGRGFLLPVSTRATAFDVGSLGSE